MSKSMITEAEMLSEFERGFALPPLRIELKESPQRNSQGGTILQATWEKQTFEFLAQFKSRSRPILFQEAVRQAEAATANTSFYPMVVLPFLNAQQLDELFQRNVSGVDLSGNGILTIPKQVLVYRTGMKNKYPESITTKYAYRGATSLVARTFLFRAQFTSLAEIDAEIRKRGGAVAMSTISKALKRMEEDLIVTREDGVIRLLQTDKLLDSLASSYREPGIRRQTTVKCSDPLAKLMQNVPSDLNAVFSGKSSLDAYAVMGRDDQPVLYTVSIDRLLESWGDRVQETRRFADLEILETDEPTVYFDKRSQNGMPYASPIQTYVECKSGDKREKEAADQVSRFIQNNIVQ